MHIFVGALNAKGRQMSSICAPKSFNGGGIVGIPVAIACNREKEIKKENDRRKAEDERRLNEQLSKVGGAIADSFPSFPG